MSLHPLGSTNACSLFCVLWPLLKEAPFSCTKPFKVKTAWRVTGQQSSLQVCMYFMKVVTDDCVLGVLGLLVPVLPPDGLRVLLEVPNSLLVVVPDPRHADVEAPELLLHTVDRHTLNLN